MTSKTHESNHVFKTLKEAFEILTSAPEIWDQTLKDLKYVDNEVTDILHEIELEEFDTEKGNELAREAKEISQRRRVIKEDKSALSIVMDFRDKNATFIKRLGEVVSLMEKEIDMRTRRIYTPRVRGDKMNVIYGENADRTDEAQEEVHFIDAAAVQEEPVIAVNL